MTFISVIHIVLLVFLLVAIFFFSCFLSMFIVTRKLVASNDLGAENDYKYNEENLKNINIVAEQNFSTNPLGFSAFIQRYGNDPFAEEENKQGMVDQ